jgi:hypothetical protein
VTAPAMPVPTVEWTIAVDDIAETTRLVQRTARIACTILGVIALAMAVLFTVATWPDLVAGVILNVPIYLAAGYLLLYGATGVIDRALMRRAAGSLIGIRETVRLDDQAITYEYPGYFCRVDWTRISSVMESDSIIVFRIEKLIAAWVPARAFANVQARRAFVAFARERIGGAVTPGDRSGMPAV